MLLTEVRIQLSPSNTSRLRAFCSLTFDHSFVIRDVKLIEGDDGLFLAMPSRKICDHCPHCHEKNPLQARFCSHCGAKLDEKRALAKQGPRSKLHADIAHPINAQARADIQNKVFDAYRSELEKSKQPGYAPSHIENLDADVHVGA
jgi:stage V sporulation protein G